MDNNLTNDVLHQLELYRASGLGGVFTVRLDSQFTLLYANDLYFILHGYAPEQLLNKGCTIFIVPEDLPVVCATLENAKKALKKNASWQMRIKTGSGEIKHTLVSGSFNTRNGEEVFDGYVTDITAQKQMEEALRESEEKFRIATENSDIAFWSYDITTKEISQTCSSKRIHGHNTIVSDVPASIIKSGYVREDSVAALTALYEALEQGAKTASGEFWFRNISGDGWWCEHIDYTTVFDENGKPRCAHAVGRDITSKKLAESRYNEEISYKNALVSENIVASMRVDLTTNIVEEIDSDYREIVKSYMGKSFSECIAALSDLLINDTQKAEFFSAVQPNKLIENFHNGEFQKNFRMQRKMPDKTYHWVSTTIKLYQKPNSDHIVGFLYSYDIDNEMLFRQIMELIAHTNYDFVGYINMLNNRYKLFANEGRRVFSELTENGYERAISSFLRRYVEKDQCKEIISKVMLSVITKELQTKDTYTVECSMIDDSGANRRKQLRFSYIDKDAQTLLYAQSDITEIVNNEKLHQEALHDALLAAEQASRAKTEFLSRMSHEIRTPMNTIIGMSALAAQSVNDPDMVADYLSKVGISARFLLSLINDILDMSRIESGKLSVKKEKIPFEEFINGINTIANAQAVAKDVDYDAVITSFVEECYLGDAMKLQQVLINIISNAIKFTPRGGKVQLMISQEKQAKDAATMKFVVNDTGIGISEEFLPKLFEPFAQQHIGATSMYGGTGLGLAICKNLIDLMGGSISVNSIEGVGSEFTIEVKLQISKEAHRKTFDKSKIHFDKLKALIVDDDILICQNTENILKDMGLHAEYVDSGRRAINRVREQWEKGIYYDVIFVDWKMPDMDGIQTTRELRKIVGPDVTIIIMTAYDWLPIESEAKAAGVNLLISKPLFRDSLSSAFEKVYEAKEAPLPIIVPETLDFSGKRVLLVEDHLLNIEVAKRLLLSKNFEVEVAENGLLAIEAFASKPVAYYDVILMDIRMPVMDGLTATKSIRQMRKEDARTIPIISMTANAFDEDIEKTKAAGMNAHIAKPIEPAILFSTLDEFLNK